MMMRDPIKSDLLMEPGHASGSVGVCSHFLPKVVGIFLARTWESYENKWPARGDINLGYGAANFLLT